MCVIFSIFSEENKRVLVAAGCYYFVVLDRQTYAARTFLFYQFCDQREFLEGKRRLNTTSVCDKELRNGNNNTLLKPEREL